MAGGRPNITWARGMAEPSTAITTRTNNTPGASTVASRRNDATMAPRPIACGRGAADVPAFAALSGGFGLRAKSCWRRSILVAKILGAEGMSSDHRRGSNDEHEAMGEALRRLSAYTVRFNE